LFFRSFRENRRILIKYGKSPLLALLIQISYTVKHFIRYKIKE
jgi:hypothetical protein